METTLSAAIGLVGILLGSLLLWIRSDIKDVRSDLRDVRSDLRDVRSDLRDVRSDIKEHGERIVRIETVVVAPPRPIRETETGHAVTG